MKNKAFKKFAALMIIAISIFGNTGYATAEKTNVPSPKNSLTYWEKYQLWNILRKGGNEYVTEDKAKTQRLLDEITKGVWLVKFEPVNGFNPKNASEFLKEVHRCSGSRSGRKRIGSASFFRTTFNGKVLIGSFLSENPEVLEKDFSKSQNIKFISSELVTPELFTKYVDSPQESLAQNSKTLGNEQKPLPQSAPPTVVVDTFPHLNETVNANAVKELRVTFSNDMNTSGCWAFCSDGENFFPDSNVKPHWIDKRTCAMPMKLIPGRTYSVTFNVGRFIGFYDIANRPSVSYKLIFKTAGKNAETPKAEKPRVISTSPNHGAVVDANTIKEISVTFNEDMNTDGYWSFHPKGRSASVFAQTYNQIHWIDKRTCVIPVKLKPGKNYSIWFNMGDSYRNFINEKGNSSIPYNLNFSTK